MKIKVAKHIGFCFGVRRAVSMAESSLKKDSKHFCLGAIIHNPQEVKRLSVRGLEIINDIKLLKKGDTLIIRSHGLLPRFTEAAKYRGANLVDATCPFVKKAQNICKSLDNEGFDVVVVGEREHPEVKSIVGFARGRASVVENLNDVKKLRLKNNKIAVLAQTTQSKEDFHNLVAALLKRYNNKFNYHQMRIFNTVCGDSAARQQAAKRISSVCDVMLVVGGKNSANSRRLAKICKAMVERTYHIETAHDIKMSWFKKSDRIGVVSGASTPDWIIEEVIKKLRTRRNKI